MLADKQYDEVMRLSFEITKLLPRRPENMGVPIVALAIAKANYMEYLRKHIDLADIAQFENLNRQVEIEIDDIMGAFHSEYLD